MCDYIFQFRLKSKWAMLSWAFSLLFFLVVVVAIVDVFFVAFYFHIQLVLRVMGIFHWVLPKKQTHFPHNMWLHSTISFSLKNKSSFFSGGGEPEGGKIILWFGNFPSKWRLFLNFLCTICVDQLLQRFFFVSQFNFYVNSSNVSKYFCWCCCCILHIQCKFFVLNISEFVFVWAHSELMKNIKKEKIRTTKKLLKSFAQWIVIYNLYL